MIKAKNLSKIYYTGEVSLKSLDRVNLEIKEGEYVAIMGRSGAGKSTLMYQLSMLDLPTEGEVIFNEVKSSTLSNGKRTHFRLTELGYVFQDFAIIPELIAMENVAVPLLMQGLNN